MTQDELNRQIQEATERVKAWPEWKQNVLLNSSQPTVKIPRQPVLHQLTWESR